MEHQENTQPLPGFRFQPTDEELAGYYLKSKVFSGMSHDDFIPVFDLHMDPWGIQARCTVMGFYEEGKEWYYFGHRYRKYPTGMRTNRATAAGFWKATGKDKLVLSKNQEIIGMRKTLVFYRGRPPNGTKTDWITYEYRLQTSQHGPPQPQDARHSRSQVQTTTQLVIPHLHPFQNRQVQCIIMILLFNQTSNFNQFTFNPSHHQDGLISSPIGDELPQPRDILNTISTMLATKEDQGLYVQNSIANKMSANNEEEKSSQFMIEPATSSYYFPNLPPLSITSTDDDMMNQLLKDYPTMYI